MVVSRAQAPGGSPCVARQAPVERGHRRCVGTSAITLQRLAVGVSMQRS